MPKRKAKETLAGSVINDKSKTVQSVAQDSLKTVENNENVQINGQLSLTNITNRMTRSKARNLQKAAEPMQESTKKTKLQDNGTVTGKMKRVQRGKGFQASKAQKYSIRSDEVQSGTSENSRAVSTTRVTPVTGVAPTAGVAPIARVVPTARMSPTAGVSPSAGVAPTTEVARMSAISSTGASAGEHNTSLIKTTESIDPHYEELLKVYKKIGNILGGKCINVVERLKLDYIPHCIQNMNFCKEHHSKVCKKPNIDQFANSTTKLLIEERLEFNFLNFVEEICMRNTLPGDYVLSYIWELILRINPKTNDNYSSKDVIAECIGVFETILATFPPCWVPQFYSNALKQPLNIKDILPSKSEHQKINIIEFVINSIDKEMSEDDYDMKTSSVDMKDLDDSDDENYFNFHHYVAKNLARHNFEILSRTDKLDRLFIVLQLIITIFELDLSIWIHRYFATPKINKHIFDEKRPLISELFFDTQREKVITELVKNAIKVFVKCASFNYPEDKITIISGLISVLSVANNLCERPNLEKIKYPNIEQQTENFAKEIFTTVDDCIGRSIPHYIAVIRHVRTPFIKYLLIDQLLNKMNRHPGKMSIKKIYENFKKERWLECSSDVEDKRSINDNDSDKYPIVLKKISKPRLTEISMQQYLDILLEALKAYCDVFAIKEIALLFNPKISANSSESVLPVIQRKIRDPKVKYNFDLIAKDIEKLVHEVNMKQKLMPNEFEHPEVDGFFVVDGWLMNDYREELKNLLKLRQKIYGYFKTDEKHKKLFKKWIDFLQNEVFKEN